MSKGVPTPARRYRVPEARQCWLAPPIRVVSFAQLGYYGACRFVLPLRGPQGRSNLVRHEAPTQNPQPRTISNGAGR